MVSLFEVFDVFFVNFRTLNSKIAQIYPSRTVFLTKLNFYFHERDSREPEVRTIIALCVKCCKQCMYSFFTIVTKMFNFTFYYTILYFILLLCIYEYHYAL
jgi:hypothetical protein